MKKVVFIGCVVVLFSACQHQQHRVSLNDQSFVIELADTDNTRALGLMYREHMADDEGMLFVFPDTQRRAFWMKNTLIPLDILYFDQNQKLVSISENTPPCKNTTTRCPNYPSAKPAKYVLEINAGLSQQYGFKSGDKLIIHLKK
ncbi:FIG007785: exported protein [hydrothermal vent metagenome]|uniref:FIG007785: exported protein n=1 Tax=hydrothermal vent metagenome TaxID=652676 RepID=A0A3B0VK72_9ZZZZ